MGASSCCGRLEGDVLAWKGSGERCFPERRRIMEAVGLLYRAIFERYGEGVDLQIVDPRNLLSLVPTLVRDFRAHRVGFVEGLRTLGGISVNTVIVNGRILSRGDWPEPEVVFAVLGPARDPGSTAPRPVPAGIHEA